MMDADKAPSSVSPGDLVQPKEIQIRILCRAKTSASALEEVRLGLEEAKSQDRDPLLIFEDLVFLQDSVSTLIKGLCRLLVGYPRTVTFWESSGYTEAFLTVMESSTSPMAGQEP